MTVDATTYSYNAIAVIPWDTGAGAGGGGGGGGGGGAGSAAATTGGYDCMTDDQKIPLP